MSDNAKLTGLAGPMFWLSHSDGRDGKDIIMYSRGERGFYAHKGIKIQYDRYGRPEEIEIKQSADVGLKIWGFIDRLNIPWRRVR